MSPSQSSVRRHETLWPPAAALVVMPLKPLKRLTLPVDRDSAEPGSRGQDDPSSESCLLSPYRWWFVSSSTPAIGRELWPEDASRADNTPLWQACEVRSPVPASAKLRLAKGQVS
jgi:hypothetical protein